MILFIASSETDYLQDLTYAGLAEILGKSRVLDFPRCWPYHKERKYFFSPKLEYPRNLGFVPGPSPGPPLEESAGNLEKNLYRLVVLGAAKPDALQVFAAMAERVKVPWVFVDGGDWKEVGGDFKRVGGSASFKLFQNLCRKFPPALVFKRELPIGVHEPRVFPLPFSFKASQIPKPSPGAKKHDVAFWAVESSETRKKAFQILRGRYDCGQNGTVAGQKFRKYALRGEKYFRELQSSKIVLSFRGEGFDTLRYWEIPACGSFMISEAPEIQIPDNFVDGRQVFFCRNDLSDLTAKIDWALAHDREREMMAQAGREHLLAHHTHLKRAEYFLEKVREKLGIDLLSLRA